VKKDPRPTGGNDGAFQEKWGKKETIRRVKESLPFPEVERRKKSCGGTLFPHREKASGKIKVRKGMQAREPAFSQEKRA